MQNLIDNEVIKEMLKLLGLIISPVLGYLLAQKSKALKKEKQDNELLKDNVYQSKINILKEIFDLQKFSELERLINLICDNTSMDRFTIMFVMNGKIDFNYMTVIYDQSKIDHSIGGTSPYAKFPIDHAYKTLVNKIEKGRPVWHSIPDKTMGNIVDFIELEGIKHIMYLKVKRIPIDEFNDIVVYLSISSTDEEKLPKIDQRKVELITAGKIVPKLEDLLTLPTIRNADELLSNLKTPTNESP